MKRRCQHELHTADREHGRSRMVLSRVRRAACRRELSLPHKVLEASELKRRAPVRFVMEESRRKSICLDVVTLP